MIYSDYRFASHQILYPFFSLIWIILSELWLDNLYFDESMLSHLPYHYIFDIRVRN